MTWLKLENNFNAVIDDIRLWDKDFEKSIHSKN